MLSVKQKHELISRTDVRGKPLHCIWWLARGCGRGERGAQSSERKRDRCRIGCCRANAAAAARITTDDHVGSGAGSLRGSIGCSTLRRRRPGSTFGCGRVGGAVERCSAKNTGTGKQAV